MYQCVFVCVGLCGCMCVCAFVYFSEPAFQSLCVSLCCYYCLPVSAVSIRVLDLVSFMTILFSGVFTAFDDVIGT